MGRFDDLAGVYQTHISAPWQRTVSGAQRVVMVVYDKEMERTLRARNGEFAIHTRDAGHDWHQVDLTDTFAQWLGADEYREEYFRHPTDLATKLDTAFLAEVADRIRRACTAEGVTENSVVAVFGAASLFGLVRLSDVLKKVEGDIKGRLVVFFPGHLDRNNYRLLDARDGWSYLATPISLYGQGGAA